MSKKMAAIWAEDQNQLIGNDMGLPWSLPADLAHFKQTTMGHSILMGRKTFDGMGRRVLPGRTNLILTRDDEYSVDHPNVLVFHGLDDVINWYQEQDKNLFITGGAEIYALFSPYIDEVIKTEIDGVFEGDTYFPKKFDWTGFETVSLTHFPKDEKNAYDFKVRVMARKG
ncbi:dihydrofolate reductase [Streptococcus moroccensis]|uniref:Dihydrofolate reductase n=1 Tax=Streptococcus moroccensis TaxID=1451356 RepID=A0ABT9YTI1_9STRE|nr:dihydrofolate reductase [Streptococcus moroccensis]MDQ0223300.1 dihydrofolate reductase [Streptococcus moroccensis]